MLTDEQLKVFSNILADLAQVSIASVVIPFLVSASNPMDIFVITAGVLVAVYLWGLSILAVSAIK